MNSSEQISMPRCSSEIHVWIPLKNKAHVGLERHEGANNAEHFTWSKLFLLQRDSSHWGSCKLVCESVVVVDQLVVAFHTSYLWMDCAHPRGHECATCGCVRESLVGDVVWDDGACYNLSEVSSEAAGVLGNCVLQCLNGIYVCVSSYRFPSWVMPPRLLSWATTPVMTSSPAWYRRTPIRHRLWWI